MRRKLRVVRGDNVTAVPVPVRPVITVLESQLNPDVDYLGALVRFVPEVSTAERVQNEIVPMLKRQGAAAVRVGARQDDEQPVAVVAADAPSRPDAPWSADATATASKLCRELKNVNTTAVEAIVMTALSKAGA